MTSVHLFFRLVFVEVVVEAEEKKIEKNQSSKNIEMTLQNKYRKPEFQFSGMLLEYITFRKDLFCGKGIHLYLCSFVFLT
jgi:hypothetical protein